MGGGQFHNHGETNPDGLLGTAGISLYLNYTYKVGDLGQAYSWQSVLSYDRAYHKLQARLSFSWGTDISHLRATTLTLKHAVNVWVPCKAGQGRGVARQGGNRTTLRMKALMFVSTFVGILIVAASPKSSVNSLTGVVWQAALASILQYHTVNMLQQKNKVPPPLPTPPLEPSALYYDVWCRELTGDDHSDNATLLEGIKHGWLPHRGF